MSQQDSSINTAGAARPSLSEALSGFYRHSMYVFLKPSVARFAEETSNARWEVVWLQILIMTLITGLLTFLSGRLSLFTPAPTLTRPLPVSIALIITVAVPGMFFLIGGITLFIAKSLDGRGTYLAQTYTALLITMPLFIFSMLIWIVSLHLALLGVILGGLDVLLFIYGVVLQIFSMMAVHRIGAGKATLIVLLQTIAIIAVILVIAFVFFVASSSSDSSNNSSASSNKSDGGSNNTDTSTGDLPGKVDAENTFLYPVYPAYHVYQTEYIQSRPPNTPGVASISPPSVNATPLGSARQPSPTPTPFPVPGAQAPAIALSEASCPTCYYMEWVGPLRVKNQLPCVHCGTQMMPTGNDHHGEPPRGYFEMQCPQCQYHEWTAQHRLDAGVMCINCDVKMQPTGNSW